MPKPENTGQGLAGKTRVLAEDAGGHPAGTEVTIVSQDGSRRTVQPVSGGDQFEVHARFLRGSDDDAAEQPDDGAPEA